MFWGSLRFSSALGDMKFSLLDLLEGTKRSVSVLVGLVGAGFFLTVGSPSSDTMLSFDWLVRRSVLAEWGRFSWSGSRNLEILASGPSKLIYLRLRSCCFDAAGSDLI